MTDTIIYERMLRFAKTKVIINSEPADVVNESYLLLLEQGVELTSSNLKRQISNQCKLSLNNNSEKWDKELSLTTNKFCKGCNEDLPIGMFGIYTRVATGKRGFQVLCKDCHATQMREINSRKPKKNKKQGISIPRSDNNNYMKEYYYRNHDKILSYNRQRNKIKK